MLSDFARAAIEDIIASRIESGQALLGPALRIEGGHAGLIRGFLFPGRFINQIKVKSFYDNCKYSHQRTVGCFGI